MKESIYDKKKSIYSGINQYLIPFISENSKILDVGCNTGQLGEFLERTKNCKVYGIDISATAIHEAKNRLSRAISMDIEKESPPPDFNNFDIIIFGDVLEHTRNPELILQKYKNYLAKNGSILTSIPNVANIIVRIKLLLGKWEYRENGVLDNTHLRFFTYKTMKKLFKKVDLAVEKQTFIPGMYLIKLNQVRFVQKLEHYVNRLSPTLFAAQFVFSLKPVQTHDNM